MLSRSEASGISNTHHLGETGAQAPNNPPINNKEKTMSLLALVLLLMFIGAALYGAVHITMWLLIAGIAYLCLKPVILWLKELLFHELS